MTEVNQDRKINYIEFNKLGNHPKSIYPYKVNKNLDTYDIPGSQPNTTSLLSKLESKYGRKLQYEKDDIIGIDMRDGRVDAKVVEVTNGK